MNIVVISASLRTNSQSLKVSKWLAEHVNSLGESGSVLDLHEQKLPLFDVGETPAPNAEKILAQLESADGLVFVSPEWNGMMSVGLANMMHYVKRQLANKPVMLVGVSSGRGGTYPIAQMRLTGYKNNHYIISPENLIVQGVNDMLNDADMSEESKDFPVKQRADYALKVLFEYAKALKNVRNSGVIDFDTFSNGV